MRPSPRWLICSSNSGALRVSPRLAELFERVLEVMADDDHHCAVCMFNCILQLLPVDEFAPMHQPYELGWGRA
jgi:hypothetical protein